MEKDPAYYKKLIDDILAGKPEAKEESVILGEKIDDTAAVAITDPQKIPPPSDRPVKNFDTFAERSIPKGDL